MPSPENVRVLYGYPIRGPRGGDPSGRAGVANVRRIQRRAYYPGLTGRHSRDPQRHQRLQFLETVRLMRELLIDCGGVSPAERDRLRQRALVAVELLRQAPWVPVLA